jgi:hypothetical protein
LQPDATIKAGRAVHPGVHALRADEVPQPN